MESLGIAHLDYLSHLEAAEPIAALSPAKSWKAIPESERFRIDIAGFGRQASLRRKPNQPDSRPTAEMGDFIVTMAGAGAPLVFEIGADGSRCQLSCGTWGSQAKLASRSAVLTAALQAQLPEIELAASRPYQLPGSWSGAISMGMPTLNLSDYEETSLDRLLRSLIGKRWRVLVVAEPVHASVVGMMRVNALAEMRHVGAEAQAIKVPDPIAEHYIEALKRIVDQTTLGASLGMWRYASYLLGDEDSFAPLCGLWRALMSGKDSSPEPIACWPSSMARSLAEGWILPDQPARNGPGSYRRMLEFQSIIHSQQLACLMQFPLVDIPGLAIRSVARFDSSPPRISADKQKLRLGEVYTGGSPGPAYEVAVDALCKHVFVAGVTGSGKTNTIIGLLKSLTASDRHFLIIEPSKTEYRSMLHEPGLASGLKIFTLGNALVSPFFLNPFEAGPDIPIGYHLDLLKSVFAASFGMWTPLPQILERCLQMVYVDQGWDLVTGANGRFIDGPVPAQAWPTLSDLIEKVSETIPTLGYDEKITADMSAALLTRLQGLGRGAKGQMLDTRLSTDFSQILQQNVVFELEGIGDDDEKAFVMGLLMTRLIQARRREEKSGTLRHLMVIEEAHRLLANVPPKASEESSNARGKAVETFSNLLAEVRSYGQGILIADQVPTKLAPDVIKNTNQKIIHRVVAGDDREVLAAAMAMDEHQKRALAILRLGQAVVFADGDNGPLKIRIPEVPELSKPWPKDAMVAAHMSDMAKAGRVAAASESALKNATAREALFEEQARAAVSDPTLKQAFQRFALTTLCADEKAPESLADVRALALQWLPPDADASRFQEKVALMSARALIQRRGRQRRWSYEQTRLLEHRFSEWVRHCLQRPGNLNQAPDAELQELAQQLFARTVEPFPGCNSICPQQECRYRNAVSDHLASTRQLVTEWNGAMNAPQAEGTPAFQAEWSVLQRHGRRLLRARDGGHLIAVSLCLSQHLLRDALPEVQLKYLASLCASAPRPAKPQEAIS